MCFSCLASDTATFEYGDTIYTLHFDQTSNSDQAQRLCEDAYASNLAMINSYEELDMLNNKLKDADLTDLVLPANWKYHECWLGGKTEAQLHSVINLHEPTQIPKEQGNQSYWSIQINLFKLHTFK